jgi:hypothetical protein
VDHVLAEEFLGAVMTANVPIIEALHRCIVERFPHLPHQLLGELPSLLAIQELVLLL